ncbi:hypothetical protein RRG08_040110 [Elysia crispata]|uniref:Uncharacterized protein n=1 Tax=Elysia crispata TaxID=231223 RepID=A0AAE1CNP1_9GAST|nr:hypothetical protein RRG08_040110 [Elysia crispata]
MPSALHNILYGRVATSTTMPLFYRKDKRKFRGAFWDIWALVTMVGFLATLLGIARPSLRSLPSTFLSWMVLTRRDNSGCARSVFICGLSQLLRDPRKRSGMALSPICV